MYLKKVTLIMEDSLYQFYKKIGESAGGLEPEHVIVDSLFKLAGTLSMNALNERNNLKSTIQYFN